MIPNRFRVSPERYEIVFNDISDGSEPEMRFYVMVAISTLIASFGLITNSTAVIIGAMLVAPLMTPIFGIALALIRSDGDLFGKALKAEIAGVLAAVLMGCILGLLYPALEPTPEMLARTEPHLFDLLVAVFSGFAGAYALMDEKISPALPGVAIATAIVPPLANTGLCFSVGQYIAGVGSFVLFFANFLSILLVASATFWLFGMASGFSQLDKKTLFKRFSIPVLCFFLVAGFLTHTLITIAKHHYLSKAIYDTLKKDLLQYQDTTLDDVIYDKDDGVIFALADVHSSSTLSPTQVQRLQDTLQQKVSPGLKLIVRSKLAQEVSALDSNVQLGEQMLDGSFISESVHPRVRVAKVADTIIRNHLATYVGYELDTVRIFEMRDIPTLLASIHGISAPNPASIEKMEFLLREKLKKPDLRLIINFTETSLYDKSGTIRIEFSGLLPYQGPQEKEVNESVAFIQTELANAGDVFVSGLNYNVINDTLYVLIETSGPKILSPEEVHQLEQQAAGIGKMDVKIFIYMKKETVVTAKGHEPLSSISKEGFRRQQSIIINDVQEILEASNM